MATLVRASDADQWTFGDHKTLQKFLSIDKYCLGRSKDNLRCNKKRGETRWERITDGLRRVDRAGFPSSEAGKELLQIAQDCICKSHGDVIVGYGADITHVSQVNYVYKKWYWRIWTAYLKANGVFCAFVDQEPPPLENVSEWKVQCESLRFPHRSPTPHDLLGSKTKRESLGSPAGKRPQETEPSDQIPRPGAVRRTLTLPVSMTGVSRINTLFKQLIQSSRSSGSGRPKFEKLPRLPTSSQNSLEVARQPLPTKSESNIKKVNTVDPVKQSTESSQLPVTPLKGQKQNEDKWRHTEDQEQADAEISPSSIGSSALGDYFSPGEGSEQITPATDYGSESAEQLAQGGRSSRNTEPLDSESPMVHMKARQHRSQQNESPITSDYAVSLSDRGPDISDDPYSFLNHSVEKPVARKLFQAENYFKKHYPSIEVYLEDLDPSIMDKQEPDRATQRSYFTKPDNGAETPYEALGKLLEKLESPILADTQLSEGYIYAFTRAGAQGYMKIGKSKQPRSRLKFWGHKCNYTPIPIFEAKMDIAAAVLETCIHHHLFECRKWDKWCEAKSFEPVDKEEDQEPCTEVHIEWFRVSVTDVLKVISLWQKFSMTRPFDHGRLNSFWRNEVIEAHDRIKPKCDAFSPLEYWSKKMESALERWMKMKQNTMVTEIKLSVRVRSEGDESVVEVFKTQEARDKLLTSVPIILKR